MWHTDGGREQHRTHSAHRGADGVLSGWELHPSPPPKTKNSGFFFHPRKLDETRHSFHSLFLLSCYKRFMNTWHVLWEDSAVSIEPRKIQFSLTVLLISYIQQRTEPRTAPTPPRANSRSILFLFLLSTSSSSSLFPLLYPQKKKKNPSYPDPNLAAFIRPEFQLFLKSLARQPTRCLWQWGCQGSCRSCSCGITAVPSTELSPAQRPAPLPGLEHTDLALVLPSFSTRARKSQIFRWEVKKRQFIYQKLLEFPFGGQNCNFEDWDEGETCILPPTRSILDYFHRVSLNYYLKIRKTS